MLPAPGASPDARPALAAPFPALDVPAQLPTWPLAEVEPLAPFASMQPTPAEPLVSPLVTPLVTALPLPTPVETPPEVSPLPAPALTGSTEPDSIRVAAPDVDPERGICGRSGRQCQDGDQCGGGKER